MASQEVLNAMEPLIYERDRQEFSLGDALDMKTGRVVWDTPIGDPKSGMALTGGPIAARGKIMMGV